MKTGWTQDEEQHLRKHFQRFGPERCAEFLNKTEKAVIVKASRLGLRTRVSPKSGFLFCSKCKLEKPTINFSSDRSENRGFSYYCKKCTISINQTPSIRLSRWVSHTIKSHEKKGCIIKFSSEELTKVANQKECSFCAQPLNWKNNRLSDDSPTLERLNNDKILTLRNTKIVCFKCNATKRNRTLSEFIGYIKDILPNLQSI